MNLHTLNPHSQLVKDAKRGLRLNFSNCNVRLNDGRNPDYPPDQWPIEYDLDSAGYWNPMNLRDTNSYVQYGQRNGQ